MAKLAIRIENHEQKFTVSQMRKRLAQILSRLNGDQPVTFTFVANLENYKPLAFTGDQNSASEVEKHFGFAAPTVVMGELARPEND